MNAASNQPPVLTNRLGHLSWAGHFQNALALERDVSRLDTLYADGVRVFGLTHMGHNDF